MLLIDVNLSLGVSDVGTRAAALAQPSTVSSSSRSACSRLDSILNSVMDHLKEVCALYENVYELFPFSCNHDIHYMLSRDSVRSGVCTSMVLWMCFVREFTISIRNDSHK